MFCVGVCVILCYFDTNNFHFYWKWISANIGLITNNRYRPRKNPTQRKSVSDAFRKKPAEAFTRPCVRAEVCVFSFSVWAREQRRRRGVCFCFGFTYITFSFHLPLLSASVSCLCVCVYVCVCVCMCVCVCCLVLWGCVEVCRQLRCCEASTPVTALQPLRLGGG